MAGQNFELRYAGRDHRVEVTDTGMSRRYVWTCDGDEVATHTSIDDRLTLKPTDAARATVPGARGEVQVRAGLIGVKRATLVVDAVEIDLVPEEGSAAARREERIRAHPRRHLVLHTTAALARVLIPLLGVGFLVSWLPDWNLPGIPVPGVDLPSIPWPSIDLPAIPWPDWKAPGWLRAVLDKAKYVWPVLLAIGIARHEVKRRRQQDARRSAMAAGRGRGAERSADKDPRSDSGS